MHESSSVSNYFPTTIADFLYLKSLTLFRTVRINLSFSVAMIASYSGKTLWIPSLHQPFLLVACNVMEIMPGGMSMRDCHMLRPRLYLYMTLVFLVLAILTSKTRSSQPY